MGDLARRCLAVEAALARDEQIGAGEGGIETDGVGDRGGARGERGAPNEQAEAGAAGGAGALRGRVSWRGAVGCGGDQRHDAQHPGDRYSEEEDAQIREAISRLRLHSAEKMFLKKSLRNVVYTTAFGGVHESIDQIYMSRHFDPGWSGAVGEMLYYSVFNDHLTDGSHPEAPYNKLASDHGQIMAHMELRG